MSVPLGFHYVSFGSYSCIRFQLGVYRAFCAQCAYSWHIITKLASGMSSACSIPDFFFNSLVCVGVQTVTAAE